MKVCGIVAEYNPFHSGHAFHIARTREALGADCGVVAVLSGNFVQRGEPAVLEKHARAEAAVRSGADLVLELPLPWAMAQAERFAFGAVSLLKAAGIVTHLSFGSECGDLAALEELAGLLARPELGPLLRAQLAGGAGYAAAFQRAAETLAGKPLPPLRAPNDILGLEYLKALRGGNGAIVPLAVRREGDGHDARAGEGAPLRSGLSLRAALLRGGDVSPWLPPASRAVLEREAAAGRAPVGPDALALPLLSRLRMLPREAFAAAPGAGEGLENRVFRAARGARDPAELLAQARTKRYPDARVRRMLWAAALGLTAADGAGEPPYLRALAFNSRGRELLARMRKRADRPVLTRPAAVRELDGRARHVFGLEAAATDLYVLGFPGAAQRGGGQEWTSGPVRAEDEGDVDG